MNVLEGRSRRVFSNGIIYLAEYILPSGRIIFLLLQRCAGMTDVPLQSLSRATSSWSTISRCLPVFPSVFLFRVCPFLSFFSSLSRYSLGATFPGGSLLEHPSQPDLPIRYLIGSRHRTAVCSSGDENCSLTLNKRYRPATNYARLKKDPLSLSRIEIGIRFTILQSRRICRSLSQWSSPIKGLKVQGR